ncbi:MAG: ZIP family metal transporter [Acidobacteriota bacterium]
MPAQWVYVILSVILVSMASLIGIATVPISEGRLRQLIFVLVSLAAGALFGDAFIHLLPESFQKGDDTKTSICILSGIITFFALEKLLRWRHEHAPGSAIHPIGYMNLFADGVHNLIDGILIGASYLVSLPLGIATAAAVILHEIPQEIGDFGILLQAGLSKTKALFFNFLSASLAMLGAFIAMLVGMDVRDYVDLMIPFTAGCFIYIAGADLMPELQKEISPAKSLIQLAAILAGMGLMLLLTLFE